VHVASIRDFTLPDLGEGLEEGEIVEWHVEVGEVVELNQPIADIETAKAVVAVPSPFAGRVVERFGEVGDTLEVGAVLVRIDVDAAGDATDAAPPTPVGASSPAQGGFETGAEAAETAVPDADAEPAEAIAGERRPSTGLDADEEPQPLVGYGQGKGGVRRRRRGGDGRGGAAPAAAPAAPLAKPPVRKLAKDLGVDLRDIGTGTGPRGSITRDDVASIADRAAVPSDAPPAAPPAPAAAAGSGADAPLPAGTAASTTRRPTPQPPAPPAASTRPEAAEPAGVPTPAPPLTAPTPGEKPVPGFRGRTPGEVEPIRGIRKRIVAKMEVSRREIPSATCSRDADLTELWELRKELTAEARAQGYEVKITPFAVVLRAAVLALRRYPTLNARIEGREGDEPGEIHLLEHIHLGVAADTERGLVVPNIKDAHTKSLLQLALELAELAGRARDGSLSPAELTGGTFTVNNYGAFGNDDGDPIINHPEGAILGLGAIRQRPWVVAADPDSGAGESRVAVRRVARFTLAFDHRICDGGEAGRFVTEVAELCAHPSRILLHA
jgi:2-oxoisovalerate dehydrogenase E2 component (dihydrolipoyl transacylase)